MQTGQSFPKFSLPNQDNQNRTLQDYAGRWLVLYIYPKDDTPGCTIQGKSFTATRAEFDAANAVVVGLSQDDVASHKNFCNKFGFAIDLLADTSGRFLKELGVGQSEWKGTMYWNRTTFLVDSQGVLRKIYENVKPEGHEKAVLADIQSLQG